MPRTEAASSADFSGVISGVARALQAEPDVERTLQGIVELAAEHLVLEHLDERMWASVSLVRGRRRVDTPASSDVRALRADQLQYELDQGPCLDAIWQHETFAIRDFAADEQYPLWSRRALVDVGVRSSLSFQLFTTGDSLGALNLYSGRVDAFDVRDHVEGLAFAAQAAVALRTAQHEAHLQSAMVNRTVIGQAQGILMERYKIDAEQAFAVLRRVSQHTNVRLHTIAAQLVETGVTPGVPGEPTA